MSFKLDLSGLFGGGGFALDPSKFDFSGLTFDEPAVAPTPVVPQQTAPVVPQQTAPVVPQQATPVAPTVSPTDSVPIVAPQPVKQPPKVVTRPDPVAIVTQQSDPIADAIASVQPDVVIPKVTAPTGMDFGIAPINPTPIANIGNLGGVSGFDVPASAVDNLLTTAKTNEEILNPLVSNIEKFEVGSGQAGLIPTSTAKELKDYVTTDEFSDIVDQYSKIRTGVSENEWEGAASRDVLDALNIPYSFETQDDFGRTSVYNFNEQTNSFDLVEEYGGTTALNEGIKTIAETAATVALTGGLGAGLASGLGVSTATGVGLATGGVSLAQGDSLDEAIVKGFTAGLGEHAKGAAEALESAQAAGESVEVIKGLQATSDVANNIKNVVNIGQAIESGDVLKGLSSGMELAGIGSLVDYTEDVVAESLGETAGMGIDGALTEWAFYNSDHIAEATVKFADTLVKGGDLGDATVGAVKEYIKDGGGIKDILPESGGLALDLDFDIPDAVEQVAQAIADGASAINRDILKPVIEGVDQLVREIPTTKEDWQEAEAFVKENTAALREDFSTLNRDVREELASFDDTYLQPIKEDFSTLNQDVRAQLSEFDSEYLQPVKQDIEQLGASFEEGLANFDSEYLQPLKEDFSGLNKDVREELASFDKDYLQPVKEDMSNLNKDVREQLASFDEDYLQPIKEDFSGLNKDVREELAGFDKEYLQPIKEDMSALNDKFLEELSNFDKDYLQPLKDDASALNEDVREQFANFDKEHLQPIKDEMSALNEDFKNGLADFDKEYLQPVKEDMSNLNQEVRDELAGFDKDYLQPIKEDMSVLNQDVRDQLADFDDNVLQPTKDSILETADNIEAYYTDTIQPSIEQGIEDTKQMLADFDDNVLQPIKDTSEQVIKTVDDKLGEFDDNVLQPIKQEISDVVDLVDQKLSEFDDNVLQEIKDAGEAGIKYIDESLSDFNKNTIKPALQSIEDALGNIDADTSGLEDMVKGLFQMFDLSTKATQGMITAATAPTYENVDLVTAELINPELTKGFEYDSLQNPFLKA